MRTKQPMAMPALAPVERVLGFAEGEGVVVLVVAGEVVVEAETVLLACWALVSEEDERDAAEAVRVLWFEATSLAVALGTEVELVSADNCETAESSIEEKADASMSVEGVAVNPAVTLILEERSFWRNSGWKVRLRARGIDK